jgi:hypothetical protein
LYVAQRHAASSAAMMNAALSMCGWTDPMPAHRPIERTHRCAVRRSSRGPSRRMRIGPLARSPIEVDRSGGARHKRDYCWFVPLPMIFRVRCSTDGEVVDVGVTCLADSQPVQAEQRCERGVLSIDPLRGEQEPTELAPVQSATLRRVDLGPSDVLGRLEVILPSMCANR